MSLPFRTFWSVAAVSVSLALAGCGNQYRPVVTSTNPVGPAGQPQKYAVAISSPSMTTTTAPGLVTFVDFSGDTVTATPFIQANPNYIATDSSGSTGFTINNVGTLDYFGVKNPAGLITSQITQTTLPSNALPTSVSVVTLSGAASNTSAAQVFIPEPGSNNIAALSSGGQLITEIGVAAVPQYVVGVNGTQRIYALSTNGGSGVASAIEQSTSAGLSVSAEIPVGTNPVYGVMTADHLRAFIMNKGSHDVSVINVTNNALDASSSLPTGTIDLTYTDPVTHATTAYGDNPVWADFSPTTSELAVLSAGDGTGPGLLTVINIPLCNSSAQPSNPSCDATNPTDASGFGTIVEQVPVGVNPTQVSVLSDGTRAYVANSGNASVSGSGSVSVVNLKSGVVTATLSTAADDATNMSKPFVFGQHPTTIAASNASPTGKVYVTSPDSQYLSVIYTDTDTVQTHVSLQGYGVRVIVTGP